MGTFREYLELIFGQSLTSNRLKNLLGLNHTEICRRWLRGKFYPSGQYIEKISLVTGKEYEEIELIINCFKIKNKYIREKLLKECIH